MAGYFQKFRKKKGIIWEPTIADQHEQNGASERLNRITIDKLHPLVISSGLPEKYWPEILLAVNYLRNRFSSSVIDKTSYETWHQQKPDLFYLYILESTAWILISKIRKLVDDKTIKYRLIGYEKDSIYRLLAPNNKIVQYINIYF
jgi:hypothetical protein